MSPKITELQQKLFRCTPIIFYIIHSTDIFPHKPCRSIINKLLAYSLRCSSCSSGGALSTKNSKDTHSLPMGKGYPRSKYRARSTDIQRGLWLFMPGIREARAAEEGLWQGLRILSYGIEPLQPSFLLS